MSVAAALREHAFRLAEAAGRDRGMTAAECGRLSQYLFSLTILAREMERAAAHHHACGGEVSRDAA